MDMNRENIEAWLLDLMEGRLSGEEVLQVRRFLEAHPELAPEGGEDLDWTLEGPSLAFPGKEALLRELPDHQTPVSLSRFDMLAIARMEGDLHASQEKALEEMMVRQPKLIEEARAWDRTRLAATPVAYPHKEKLLHKASGKRINWWISAASAAAAAVLLLVLFRSGPDLSESRFQAASIEEGMEIAAPELLADADEPRTGQPATPGINKLQEPEALTGEPAPREAEASVTKPPVRESPDSPQVNPAPSDIESSAVKLALHQRVPVHPGTEVVFDRIQFQAQSREYVESPAEQGLINWKRLSRESIRLAQAGIQGFNRMTGSDMELKVEEDESGRSTSFRFRSGYLNVDASTGHSD
jgi:hypothetical protein